nr:toll-like receptor 6 [Leptinotarsa decemlineata]
MKMVKRILKRFMWDLKIIFFCYYLLEPCAGLDCEESAATEQQRKINYGYYNSYSYVTIVHNITLQCSGVTLPLPHRAFEHNCDNCPRVMKIVSSNLPVIPSAAFSKYSTTSILHMERLYIGKLSPGAFNSLYSLKEVYLSENNITELSPGIFNSLSELQILDLSKNDLKTLGPSCLTGAINLISLNLSLNSLKSFDELVLDQNIIKLEYIDLSFNQITEINIRSIRHKIDNIDLSWNQITNIDFCINGFKSITVSKNRLKSIGKNNCSNVTSRVINFDLSYNIISELFSDTFEHLNTLKILKLEHNNISSLPIGLFSDLSSLINLNLSNNKLEQFYHGTFENLKNLQILDISNNKITDVKRYLHSLANMNELYIQQNKLFHLDSEQIIADSPHVSKISLGGNNFTCDDLIEIIHYFRSKSVIVAYGSVRNSSNIQGIPCFDNSNFPPEFSQNSDSNTEKNLLNKVLPNEDYKTTIMYDYFNEGFKNSNFYRYLESMKEHKLLNFSDSKIYSFFNNGFENSKFYRYLENLKNVENFTVEFNEGIYEYFDKDFKNSGFVKYLENIKNYHNISLTGISNNAMKQEYGEDFIRDKLQKYLGGLQINQTTPNSSEYIYGDTFCPEFEKVEVREILLIVTILVLIIIATILIILTYIVYNSLNKMKNTNERMELLNA